MRSISVADVDIPVIGFGTWRLSGDACRERVEDALRLGYRHLDTAAMYDNEREVGEGLRASGVAREDVFVTTKVWRDDAREDAVLRSCEASLKRLRLDRVDLLLLHWPNEQVPLKETLRGLARSKREGMTRAIGVSNFPAAMVEEAAARSDEPLATNQVEYHPYLSQRPVLEAVRRRGMTLTAYSPLAQGAVVKDDTVAAMAAEHGVTPGQIALRWLIQQGDVIAIPKTASRERAGENLDVFSFQLTDDEMSVISGLARPDGRTIDPSFAPRWDDPAAPRPGL